MKAQFFITDKAEVPTLVLKGEWCAEVAEYMRCNRIIGLRLSGYMGWRSADLNFLREVPSVEYLDILTTTLNDISGLYALKQLTYLSLEGKTPAICFSEFPRLKTLALGRVSARLHNELTNAKSLRKLGITGPTNRALMNLHHLPILQDLGVARAKIEDLEFVDSTPALRKLSLVACNRLARLTGLERATELTVLLIEQAKVLCDIRSVGHLERLRTLVLNQCPNIRTIKSLAGLRNLETVGLMQTTNIADGDLSPLLTLPNLRNATFIDRPHYSHSNQEFPKDQQTFY